MKSSERCGIICRRVPDGSRRRESYTEERTKRRTFRAPEGAIAKIKANKKVAKISGILYSTSFFYRVGQTGYDRFGSIIKWKVIIRYLFNQCI
jgi:hypothetical protein